MALIWRLITAYLCRALMIHLYFALLDLCYCCLSSIQQSVIKRSFKSIQLNKIQTNVKLMHPLDTDRHNQSAYESPQMWLSTKTFTLQCMLGPSMVQHSQHALWHPLNCPSIFLHFLLLFLLMFLVWFLVDEYSILSLKLLLNICCSRVYFSTNTLWWCFYCT